jgi:hypothetical protein
VKSLISTPTVFLCLLIGSWDFYNRIYINAPSSDELVFSVPSVSAVAEPTKELVETVNVWILNRQQGDNTKKLNVNKAHEKVDESLQSGKLKELWIDDLRYSLTGVFKTGNQKAFATLNSMNSENKNNNKKVAVGDSLQGYSVDKITSTSVILSSPYQNTIELLMFQPQQVSSEG